MKLSTRVLKVVLRWSGQLPCGLLLLVPWSGEPASGQTPAAEIAVTASWLAGASAAADLRILDARPASAYERGHLPGSISCEVGPAQAAWGPGAIGEALAACSLSGEERVVLYGDAGSYDRVGTLFWLLEWAGQREVRVLDGGLPAWTQAGGRLETRRPPPLRGLRFRAAARPDVTADPRRLAGLTGMPGTEILDLRDRSGWQGPGRRPPPRFAAGHIPHALPLDLSALLPGDGTWPSPQRIFEAVAPTGPRPGTRIDLRATLVLYGEGAEDRFPGLGYLLLRLIGADVRVLPGGFPAWTGAGGAVVRVVSAAELARRLERENPGLVRDLRPRRLLLFDLRLPGAAEHERLPGSVAAPAERFAAELDALVEAGWPGVDRARVPIALYCYDRDCIRSRDGCAVAARAGFRDILWLRDGVAGWKEAGYPLVGTPAP